MWGILGSLASGFMSYSSDKKADKAQKKQDAMDAEQRRKQQDWTIENNAIMQSRMDDYDVNRRNYNLGEQAVVDHTTQWAYNEAQNRSQYGIDEAKAMRDQMNDWANNNFNRADALNGRADAQGAMGDKSTQMMLDQLNNTQVTSYEDEMKTSMDDFVSQYDTMFGQNEALVQDWNDRFGSFIDNVDHTMQNMTADTYSVKGKEDLNKYYKQMGTNMKKSLAKAGIGNSGMRVEAEQRMAMEQANQGRVIDREAEDYVMQQQRSWLDQKKGLENPYNQNIMAIGNAKAGAMGQVANTYAGLQQQSNSLQSAQDQFTAKLHSDMATNAYGRQQGYTGQANQMVGQGNSMLGQGNTFYQDALNKDTALYKSRGDTNQDRLFSLRTDMYSGDNNQAKLYNQSNPYTQGADQSAGRQAQEHKSDSAGYGQVAGKLLEGALGDSSSSGGGIMNSLLGAIS